MMESSFPPLLLQSWGVSVRFYQEAGNLSSLYPVPDGFVTKTSSTSILFMK